MTTNKQLAYFNDFNDFDIDDEEIDYNEGASSVVIFAKRVDNNKQCILKKYLEYDVNNFKDSEIINEILTLKKLNMYKSFPELQGILADGEDFYVVLEKIDSSLTNKFKEIKNESDWKFKLEDFITDLLEEVYKIHSTGYVHGDLKLDNILCTKNGSIKIIDFGNSQFIGISPCIDKIKTYSTTQHIKAPDSGNEEKIIINDKDHFLLESDRTSYSSDVFSLGNSILNLIFEDNNSYIAINDTIYIRNGHNYTTLDINKEYLLKSIKYHQTNLYVVIYNMMQYISSLRKSIKNILELDFDFNEIYTITDVSKISNPINSDKISMIINDRVTYTYDDIINDKYELQYINEIHKVYKNDILIKSKINDNILNIIDKLLSNLFYHNKSIPFDSILNSISIISKYKGFHFDIYSLIVINFFSNIELINPILSIKNICEIASCTKEQCLEIEKYFTNNNILNVSYIPIYTHIKYYLIVLLKHNINLDVVNDIEKYIVKNIFKYTLHDHGNFFIDMLIQSIIKDYYENNMLSFDAINIDFLFNRVTQKIYFQEFQNIDRFKNLYIFNN